MVLSRHAMFFMCSSSVFEVVKTNVSNYLELKNQINSNFPIRFLETSGFTPPCDTPPTDPKWCASLPSLNHALTIAICCSLVRLVLGIIITRRPFYLSFPSSGRFDRPILSVSNGCDRLTPILKERIWEARNNPDLIAPLRFRFYIFPIVLFSDFSRCGSGKESTEGSEKRTREKKNSSREQSGFGGSISSSVARLMIFYW